jgi:hypothetical protein
MLGLAVFEGGKHQLEIDVILMHSTNMYIRWEFYFVVVLSSQIGSFDFGILLLYA